MERDIQFRGKRTDNKEWIFGDLIKHSIVSPFTYISKGTGYKVDDPEIGKPIKIFPGTLGQLTTLKDKNGKQVWEGDIFTLHGKRYEVRYENSIFLFVGALGGITEGFIQNPFHELIGFYRFNNTTFEKLIEVVGTIHDEI